MQNADAQEKQQQAAREGPDLDPGSSEGPVTDMVRSSIPLPHTDRLTPRAHAAHIAAFDRAGALRAAQGTRELGSGSGDRDGGGGECAAARDGVRV